MIKRLTDIFLSVLLLLLLSPVLIFLSVAIKFKVGSPVLFRQNRPGMYGKPFTMVKFRTMLNDADYEGELLPDSERILPFGKLLREASLDELPELWNVLKGEMSLVGPRPLLMEYLPMYSSYQKIRHNVRPGITGWAQVNGRNAISWEEKFSLDVWYVENQTFWLDIKILLITLKKVIMREGISADGKTTMPKFSGNKK